MEHKNRCKVKKVFATENGSVYQCIHCQKYQVSFGNMLVYYTPEDFSIFSEFVLNLDLDNPRKYVSIGNKIIVQPAMNTGLCLFTVEELQELNILIEGCYGMENMALQLKEILHR